MAFQAEVSRRVDADTPTDCGASPCFPGFPATATLYHRFTLANLGVNVPWMVSAPDRLVPVMLAFLGGEVP